MSPSELIGQLLANFVVASLVYYFMTLRLGDKLERITELKSERDALKQENDELRRQHDDDVLRLSRKRGDTGRIPNLPPDEIEKAKKNIGLS